ncbi:hypothetical protein QV65_18255 [Rhodococcus erythropolis]|nr:hypothetical protein QV65_18255 [Rhodococcus erythropolis]
MTTYRYLDADRNLLEEKDFETEQDAQEYRLSVLGAEHIEPAANDPVDSPIGQGDFAAVVSSAIKA